MKRVCFLLIVAANTYGIHGPFVFADAGGLGGNCGLGGPNEIKGLNGVSGSTDANSSGLPWQSSPTRMPGPLAQDSKVPEPTTACLLLVAAAVGLCHHPRGSRRLQPVTKLIRSCVPAKSRKTPKRKSAYLM